MIKKIGRPDWDELYFDGQGSTSHKDAYGRLDKWFDATLKDHYAVHKDDLIEIRGQNNKDHKLWCTDFKDAPYKAYLIKSSIEPTKQETCADVLREILQDYKSITYGQIKRAKAALERHEKD
jgi:hypothetical protein